MIHNSIVDCIGRVPLVYLNRLFPQPGPTVIAKLEFLNPGGSIKDRPAQFIIEEGLKNGTITANTHLVESTSGNLGIAVAMVARVYDLKFTAVVDPKISVTNLRILEKLGADIDMVHLRDSCGSYLQTRLMRVQELVRTVPNCLWINQYANPLNWKAHHDGTGTEIVNELDGPIDCFLTSVSTTGTIMGVSRRLRAEFPDLRVIAVDAVGSIIFGTPAARREIPGIGASKVPELLSTDEIDEVVLVNDRESAYACQTLLKSEGIFVGGSSGAVVAAILKLLPTLPESYRIVTLFPDRGERYLDLIYDDQWLATLDGPNVETIEPVNSRTHLILDKMSVPDNTVTSEAPQMTRV